MKRVVPFVVVLVGLVLASCGGEEPAPKGGKLMAVWPRIECPTGSGVLAEARLLQIEAWAPPGSDARSKAQACRTTHTGTNEIHCAKVFAAWSAAQAAQEPLLSPEQKLVLFAFCASELTHESDGGGLALGGGVVVWPDVESPPLSGVSARQRLDQIILWATEAGKLDAKTKAEECLLHTVDSVLHRFRVYGAWEAANMSRNPLLSPGERDALWLLCVSELTHESDGGGTAGG